MSDPESATTVEGQRAVFQSRQASREGQADLIRGQVEQARTQIETVKVERAAVQDQLRLIDRELKVVREMYETGLERLRRVLALACSEAGIRGQAGRLTGPIAQHAQPNERGRAAGWERV